MGAPPHGNQVPLQQQAPQGDQASFNPPAMMDGEIRSSFLSVVQAMTIQAQAMMDQANREVVPCVN